MNRRIALLALAAVGAAVVALPVMASASTALHLNPTPDGAKAIDGGEVRVSTTTGATTTCNTVKGGATFNAGGTSGTINLTFTGDCRENLFGSTCTNETPNKESITTTALPFHLVTLANNKPGVLVTPNDGHFTTFECMGGLVNTTVGGNGWIGRITSSGCGKVDSSMVIDFNAIGHGAQEYTTVAGTSTSYRLTIGGGNVALDVVLTVALGEESELECT